jgi:hypothetical protein
MAYFVVPICSIFSVLILPLFLYWYPSCRNSFFYSKVDDIKKATHVKVVGVKGNIEIIPLKAGSLDSPDRDVFTYRFINFKFCDADFSFKPVVFDIVNFQEDILK